MILGAIGIGIGFMAAPKTIEDVEKLLSYSHNTEASNYEKVAQHAAGRPHGNAGHYGHRHPAYQGIYPPALAATYRRAGEALHLPRVSANRENSPRRNGGHRPRTRATTGESSPAHSRSG